MIISTIDFVGSYDVFYLEIDSFINLPRTNKLKEDNPKLWSPYNIKNRQASNSLEEVDIYALVIDWDHEIIPNIWYRHFRHKTHSGCWRIIIPFDKMMKMIYQDFISFYEEIMDKLGLRPDDKTLGIEGYDPSAKRLSQFFYYPHSSVEIEEVEGEQLLSTIFLTQTSKIRRLWRKSFYPNFEMTDLIDRYHKKILALHRGYKDSCDFSELRLSRDHCWFHKERVGELDLNTFEGSGKAIGANIHCYHTNCFLNNKQFITSRYPTQIKEDFRMTETSTYLLRGLIEKFWDWNFIEEMYIPKVLKSKHHLLVKLNKKYPEDDVKLLKSILYDDKIVFNPEDSGFYLFTEKIYKNIDVRDIGDRLNTRLFKWYRYLGYKKDNMNDWIKQFESSIRDKKLEELKMESGLALRNGVLTFNKETGDHTLHVNDGSYFIKDFKDYDYDPQATCPRWMQALDEWFDNSDKTKSLLQEFAGYCLTDWRHFEKFLVMYNRPGAGKNTIANVLMSLTSSSACVLTRLNSETICHDMSHFKMLFCDEKVHSIKDSILDLLKQIVTTSPIFCRKLFETSYSSEHFPKLLLAFNEVPESFKMDEALQRRLLVINFKNSFMKSDLNKSRKTTDPNLGDTLKSELSGILNWALVGLKRLIWQGEFTVDILANKELVKKSQELDMDRYKVYKFVDQLGEGTYSASELYEGFTSNRENRRVTIAKFGAICKEMHEHFEVKRKTKGIEYTRSDYKGIDHLISGYDLDL